MKKLFTFAVALAASYAMYAQDASKWEKDQDVTADLIGDYDGTFSGTLNAGDDSNRPNDMKPADIGKYWKGSCFNEYHKPDTYPGIYGFYNAGLIDVYQVVKFPAGVYQVDVQALYREGTPQDNFTNFFNKKKTNYGHMYVSMLDGADANSTVTRTVDKVLVTIAESEQTETYLYHYDENGSWMNDFEYLHEGVKYYCPKCLSGFGAYVQAGKYKNKLSFALDKDTYIRLGFKKTGSIGEDWLVFTNLKITYQGEANSEAFVQMSKTDCANALAELEDVKNDISAAGFTGYAGIVSDLLIDYNDSIDDYNSVEELSKLALKIKEVAANYSSSLQSVKNLSDLISMSNDMLSSTDFPGKTAFEAVVSNANAKATTKDAAAIGDDANAYFSNIFNELSKARADYLNTQDENELGEKDFTSLVKNPWLVNPEFNPTYNADDDTWTLKHPDWQWGQVQGQGNFTEKLVEIDLNDGNGPHIRENICSKVVLSPSDDVTNQWYKYAVFQGWSPGVQLFYQSGLIGVSDGWNSFSGDSGSGEMGIRQQLVGLPNGYYSLNGLMRGNTGANAWNGDYHNIFAKNSADEYVYSQKGCKDTDGWATQWGFNEWNPKAWAAHKTGVVHVTDGKLLIGGQTSMVANMTGFRLMFHGTEPKFNDLVLEEVAKVKALYAGLYFAGDTIASNKILEKIIYPVSTAVAYAEAIAITNNAKQYCTIAKTGQEKYTALSTITSYSDYKYVAKLYRYLTDFGSSETDSYTMVDTLNQIANAYVSYVSARENAEKYKDDAAISNIIKSQDAVLNANYVSVETINAYATAIATPANVIGFTKLGCDAATEANPVSVTSLITNPNFVTSVAQSNTDRNNVVNNGWTSTESASVNEYGRNAAELWNKSPFTYSQVLRGLPGGLYELKVKAIYRDGGSVDSTLVANYRKAGNEENWANHNAVLFAKASDENNQSTYLKAIESLNYTEVLFDKVYKTYGQDGDNIYPTAGEYLNTIEEPVEEGVTWTSYNVGAYPFDTKVTVDGINYYYPSSMYGFYMVCQKNPEAVTNTVRIRINSGDNLEVGLKKEKAINSDWVIFTDFELNYLSGEEFAGIKTGIEDIQNEVTDDAVYNLAGQRVNNNFKGIVIQNGKKVMR